MNSKNFILVTGHVTANATCDFSTKVNAQVVEFDIAVSNSFKLVSTGEKKTNKQFYTSQIFFPKNKPVKIHEFLLKDKLVSVVGEPRVKTWIKNNETQGKTFIKLELANLKLL